VLLAHCPERILPGDIMHEIVHNDRIIGGFTPESTDRARAMYASFVQGALLETDDVTAELCKLMENTYRDVNIALANEFAAVSESLGVDVMRAIELANRHPRVDILKPGIGTGGHCIPIDPWFIRQVSPDNARLIDTARRINGEVPSRIAGKIRRAVAGITAPRIAAVGVTYKPDTADCRESPAIAIIDQLRGDGYDVAAYDPLAESYPWPSGGLHEIARGTDCLVMLVEHRIVRQELAERGDDVLAAMRTPLIVRFYQTAGEGPTPWQAVAPPLVTVS
jgi:UDP-N-acetyl-D-mannosaminuronic acid dehydrogenase